MDYGALKADLLARFPGATDPQATAAAMNALPPIAVVGLVPTNKLLIWTAKYNVAGKLQARAANAADPLQSAAIAIILACQGGLPGLDLSDPDVPGMVGAFVTIGDVSQGAAAALTALGTTSTPYIQRTYGVPYVSADDVSHAWNLA